MLDWVLQQVAVATLGAVFLLALIHKGRGYQRFRASLSAYDIVPTFLIGLAAPFVLLLEAVALLCLFLPVGPGSLLAFCVLGVYTIAISVNLARGRRAIDCGCGDRPTPLSGWLLLRNGLLMALAWPYAVPEGYAPTPGAWMLVATSSALLVIVYLTIEELLANGGLAEARYG